jgi:hypothetical protein
MLLNNVTPQTSVSMPSTALEYPRPPLRVFTGARSPLYRPSPRLHSQLEVVRTAPLLLNPPPARRAISQNVDTIKPSIPTPAPTPPPRTRPDYGHKRKLSEKLKSIFHTRQTSEPINEPGPPVGDQVFDPAMGLRAAHKGNESAPDERVVKWVKQQTTEATKSPPRPLRSPDTASFVVSSLATGFTFPRYSLDAASTPSLHPDSKETFDPLDEDELLEPITAALYPHGKGLLGTTQRRARFQHEQTASMFRFDDPRPPAYSFERNSQCGAGSSEVSEDHFSDFAQWYVAPK